VPWQVRRWRDSPRAVLLGFRCAAAYGAQRSWIGPTQNSHPNWIKDGGKPTPPARLSQPPVPFWGSIT
jgi:hypothetical protein